MSIGELTPAPAPAPVVPRREIRVVEDHGPLAFIMDTARFEHMQRISHAMAAATLMPDHLVLGRDKKDLPIQQAAANCLMVVNQALRWGFDPFAVAPETYVVGNKLGFQGKLVAAVVNVRAGLIHALKYEHSGEGDNRTVKVIGQFEGESEPRTVECVLKNVRTSNDMWRKDPDQKLCYTGAIKWARRHCPQVILGVLTDDDLEQMERTAAIQTNARLSVSPLDARLMGPASSPEPTNGNGHAEAQRIEASDSQPVEVASEPAKEPEPSPTVAPDLVEFRQKVKKDLSIRTRRKERKDFLEMSEASAEFTAEQKAIVREEIERAEAPLTSGV